MGFHFIEDAGLIRVVRQAIPAGQARELITQGIERWLSRQPRSPRLIGTTAAAKILGIQPPHVTRLREQGRMPEPIQVEGSNDVWIREEVEALARELHAERQARAERKAAREEARA